MELSKKTQIGGKLENEPVQIPENLLRQLAFWADSLNLGMSNLGNSKVSIVIVGHKEIGVNTAAVIAAHLLLGGVVTGAWEAANLEAPEDLGMPKDKM